MHFTSLAATALLAVRLAAGQGTGVATATPSDPTTAGSIPNCATYYQVVPGSTCQDVLHIYNLTLSMFIQYNPALNMQCTNLNIGYSYCVAAVPGTFVPPTTSFNPVSPTSGSSLDTGSPSESPIPPPGPTQAGTTSVCRQWVKIQSGDTCTTLSTKYNLSAAQFAGWNSGLNAGCTNLLAGFYYCVAGPTSAAASGMVPPPPPAASGTAPAGAQQTLYGQCGGAQWTGPTSCAGGYQCWFQNSYYSQCLGSQGFGNGTAGAPPAQGSAAASGAAMPSGTGIMRRDSAERGEDMSAFRFRRDVRRKSMKLYA